MPVNDPKDLRPPVKYKPRPVARQLGRAEIKAAADRAEARSMRATAQVANDPPNASAEETRLSMRASGTI